MVACYIGYITQAIVINFAPLLFLLFHNEFEISLEQIGALIAINFLTQLGSDLFSAKFVDKLGYRRCTVAAHIFSAVGLVMLGILPYIMPPYAGLIVATVLYAVGGGLIETVICPILEACPIEQKSAAMSFLHSFYCWGSVLVIGVSSAVFAFSGIASWRILSMVWAIIPAINGIYFCFVPIGRLTEEGKGKKITELLKMRDFLLLEILMLCAGIVEQSISQWASAFAESGLGVDKTVGDIAGPCMFAICMGIGRITHSALAEKISLEKYLTGCAVGCLVGYLIASLSPWAGASLGGCALCGFSVAAMWPGIYSLATGRIPSGGTAMFALLALAGDCGCSIGPVMVGFVAGALGNNLRLGIFSATAFALVFIVAITLMKAIPLQDNK